MSVGEGVKPHSRRESIIKVDILHQVDERQTTRNNSIHTPLPCLSLALQLSISINLPLSPPMSISSFLLSIFGSVSLSTDPIQYFSQCSSASICTNWGTAVWVCVCVFCVLNIVVNLANIQDSVFVCVCVWARVHVCACVFLCIKHCCKLGEHPRFCLCVCVCVCVCGHVRMCASERTSVCAMCMSLRVCV